MVGVAELPVEKTLVVTPRFGMTGSIFTGSGAGVFREMFTAGAELSSIRKTFGWGAGRRNAFEGASKRATNAGFNGLGCGWWFTGGGVVTTPMAR
jgi:hypothetical protein